jgi:hypothetical protein
VDANKMTNDTTAPRRAPCALATNPLFPTTNQSTIVSVAFPAKEI